MMNLLFETCGKYL